MLPLGRTGATQLVESRLRAPVTPPSIIRARGLLPLPVPASTLIASRAASAGSRPRGRLLHERASQPSIRQLAGDRPGDRHARSPRRAASSLVDGRDLEVAEVARTAGPSSAFAIVDVVHELGPSRRERAHGARAGRPVGVARRASRALEQRDRLGREPFAAAGEAEPVGRRRAHVDAVRLDAERIREPARASRPGAARSAAPRRSARSRR